MACLSVVCGLSSAFQHPLATVQITRLYFVNTPSAPETADSP
jgi:hypothetical protein